MLHSSMVSAMKNDMPTKFRETEETYDRRTGKTTITYNYMKATPRKDLFDYINSPNAKPKIVHKCINELTRRGIKIEWRDRNEH